MASTAEGIWKLTFVEDATMAIADLHQEWPNATLVAIEYAAHALVGRFFARSFLLTDRLHLHPKGTPFQLKIWESLLQISEGELRTYAQLAAAAEN